jgi:hypothetical protein
MNNQEEQEFNQNNESDDPNQVTLSIDEDYVFRVPRYEMGD